MPDPRSNRRRRPLIGLVLALIGLMALAACSPAASSPTESSPASSAAGDADRTVTITSSSFGDDFTIPAGGTVVFVNNAGTNHTVTNGVDGVAAEDPLFDIQLADGESSDPIAFDEPGTYEVTCTIHPSMQLTITVE
jgi:plastocyanin